MIQYHVSDYLYLKENADKVADSILNTMSHCDAFIFYKIILNAICNSNPEVEIKIDLPEKYLEIDFLRLKFIELFNITNELCKTKMIF